MTDPIYNIRIDSLDFPSFSADKSKVRITDSVGVSFTIALYSISGKESFRVYSNPINIAYIDLLKSKLKQDHY